jgi:hypothetical protein
MSSNSSTFFRFFFFGFLASSNEPKISSNSSVRAFFFLGFGRAGVSVAAAVVAGVRLVSLLAGSVLACRAVLTEGFGFGGLLMGRDMAREWGVQVGTEAEVEVEVLAGASC